MPIPIAPRPTTPTWRIWFGILVLPREAYTSFWEPTRLGHRQGLTIKLAHQPGNGTTRCRFCPSFSIPRVDLARQVRLRSEAHRRGDPPPRISGRSGGVREGLLQSFGVYPAL